MYVEGYNIMFCYLFNCLVGIFIGDILKYIFLLYFNDVVIENVFVE